MIAKNAVSGWDDRGRVPTFALRGVAVPFTSPCLTGVYAVRTTDGPALRQWGGGCGALDWSMLTATQRVTLHDRMLFRTLAFLDELSPWDVRRATRVVAESGAAGRAAQSAARMADARDEEERRICAFMLVVRLLEDHGITGLEWHHLGPFDPEFHEWLLASAERLVPAVVSGADSGQTPTPQSVLGWVEALAGRIAPIGLPRGPFAAWQEGMVDQLRAFATGVAAYAGEEAGRSGGDPQVAATAHGLAQTADYVIRQVGWATDAYHAAFQDMARVYTDWPTQGTVVLARVARIEWLLDGWAPVCRLWEEAAANGRQAQRVTVNELRRRVPVIPAEAGDWHGEARPPVAIAAADIDGAVVARDAGMTECGDLERILRNETLRACAA